jgi:GNAT superfamily N-acetyltransferase
MGKAANAIQIYRYQDLGHEPALARGMDRVFFESSNTQEFADDASRAAFRERWLGRYLTHDSAWAYIVLAGDTTVAGYLVASLDDPATAARFVDIPYFAHFAGLTKAYPAHLHVNLSSAFRNRGIGGELIERFAVDARNAGAVGVHVVTSRGARNIAFYNRNGFAEAGAHGTGGREVVFLARALNAHKT